jgi:hypothetical protein
VLAVAAATLIAVACAQSDAGITTKVKSKLAQDDTVKASQVNVDTKDKVVTLTGTVDNDAAKTRAVELARDTTGVRDVVDNLSVAGSTPSTTGATGDMSSNANPPTGSSANPSATGSSSANSPSSNPPGSSPSGATTNPTPSGR